MTRPERSDRSPQLPRLAAALLRLLLPYAERQEVLSELRAEYGERAAAEGSAPAGRWVWRQVLSSVPALAGRGWWRGWTGFQPRANRMRPGSPMFESWGQDVKFALRRLRRRRTYATLTVLTLALGVAGTAAVYSIARRLLMEPLPYRAEEELVVFWNQFDWSEAEFLSVRPDIEDFRSLAAYRNTDVTLTAGDGPARLLPGVSGTAELFQVLGVSPAIGPGFRAGDDRLGAEPVAVLSHALWRELGADPQILGQRVELGGASRTVVGVMPEGFWFPDPTVKVWLAEELNPDNESGNYALVGRMPPGATVERMYDALNRITAMLDERFDYPAEWDKTRNAELTPLREYLVGSVRPALLAMLGAMAVILLIACVNVAALMLGQVDARETELAVRAALGSARRRLVQQLAVEALVIGALAGVVGAALAVAGFRFMVSALPLGALAESTSVDWVIFASSITIALVAATAIALAPGASVARSDLQARLARSRTGGVAGRGGRLEAGLVVAQVSLVVLMASGAALLIRSVDKLSAIDPGLDPEGVAVVDVVLPATDPERRPQLLHELFAELKALPGVADAAAVQKLPLRGSGDSWGILIEDQPDREPSTTYFRMVTPNYFETMGIRVVRGRGFQESDRVVGEEGVIVINQALADQYFPGVDPIGKRIALGERWNRVVGVIENVAESDLTAGPEPARYMVQEHLGGIPAGQTIVIRMQPGRDAAAVLDEARRAIQAAAPAVAVRELTTMESVFTRAIGPARQVMSLLSLLGALALALGTVGVYGVVSHFVTRRKRDWGIRMALGLRPGQVVRRVVGRGGALVGGGIALGLAAFLWLAKLLATFLYGVGTADPVALAAAAAVLLGTGLAAAYLPARRASRIDPALVLREQ